MVEEGHALRTDGPYGITRHPIYTGILGMLVGSLLLAGVGRSILLLPVGLVLFEVKLHVEEELMLATFPERPALPPTSTPTDSGTSHPPGQRRAYADTRRRTAFRVRTTSPISRYCP